MFARLSFYIYTRITTQRILSPRNPLLLSLPVVSAVEQKCLIFVLHTQGSISHSDKLDQNLETVSIFLRSYGFNSDSRFVNLTTCFGLSPALSQESEPPSTNSTSDLQPGRDRRMPRDAAPLSTTHKSTLPVISQNPFWFCCWFVSRRLRHRKRCLSVESTQSYKAVATRH